MMTEPRRRVEVAAREEGNGRGGLKVVSRREDQKAISLTFSFVSFSRACKDDHN